MGKRIVLGVTGSVAAYKAAELVRLFVTAGDDVTVVMTPAACEFVKPLTFQTLSRNPVFVDQFAPPVSWKPEHISLAESAEVMVVAPASANTLAKMRAGIADNLLAATLLATRAPVVVAPAMNDGMWESPVTQENIAVLASRGVTVVDPDDGELACGRRGKGRMCDPNRIFEAVRKVYAAKAQETGGGCDRGGGVLAAAGDGVPLSSLEGADNSRGGGGVLAAAGDGVPLSSLEGADNSRGGEDAPAPADIPANTGGIR